MAKIKVLCGCFTWNAIWCGEKRNLLPLVTFSSTVNQVLLLLTPNRSGVPKELVFSIFVHLICGVFFFQ